MESEPKPERIYTQAELDAQIKFLNHCITRQFKIIQHLRQLLKESEARNP